MSCFENISLFLYLLFPYNLHLATEIVSFKYFFYTVFWNWSEVPNLAEDRLHLSMASQHVEACLLSI